MERVETGIMAGISVKWQVNIALGPLVVVRVWHERRRSTVTVRFAFSTTTQALEAAAPALASAREAADTFIATRAQPTDEKCEEGRF